MNFGFRYHLASLMAVFLSLILGILIGGALFPDNALVEEQDQLISNLEEYFVQMQEELQLLNTQLTVSDSAWSELRDNLFKSRLMGKTIIMIAENSQDDYLVEMLSLTGAEMKVITLEVLPLVVPDEEVFFLTRLSNEELTTNLLDEINRIVENGGNMVFVWDTTIKPSLQGLPLSLQIDGVDTKIGQIALVLGLLTKGKGHYGMHKESKGLFPL
ncbi:MAG: copper transporter [Bacillota bacterium]|nr:copper transporter [Bacillota bacterium]